MTVFKFLSNYNSYLVGGAIRDLFLKKKITDIDIVIVANIIDFKKIIKQLSKKYLLFPLDRERNIYRIMIGNKTIDITNASSLVDDLKKRDFTINSLAAKITDTKIKIKKEHFSIKIPRNKIIDNFNAIKDIENKRLVAISETSLILDPLRILRAYRFFATDEFKITKNLKKQIIKNKEKIHISSKERIREELIKIFKSDNTYATIKEMAQSEILFEIFPKLKEQINCATIYYGKGGVFKHTLNVIKRLDMFFKKPRFFLEIPKNLNEKIQKEKYLIKLSALLHDISKPQTQRIINKRLRFFGHERKGAEVSEKILREYRFSNDEIKYIKTVISSHLRIGNIAHNENITNKAILRIFYDLKEYSLGNIILSWADYSSHISEKKLITMVEKVKEKPFKIRKPLPKTGIKKTLRFLQVVNLIVKSYDEYQKKANIKPIIDGYTVMRTLKIPPSKLVGIILKKLINLQLENKITTRKEALNYIKSLKIDKLRL